MEGSLDPLRDLVLWAVGGGVRLAQLGRAVGMSQGSWLLCVAYGLVTHDEFALLQPSGH